MRRDAARKLDLPLLFSPTRTVSGAMGASSSCNPSQIAGCENPRGSLADGAPCYDGIQCQSSACKKTGSGGGDAGTTTGLHCGTCDPRAAENAKCDNSGATAPQCMSGLSCTNGTCVKPTPIPVGNPCSFSGPPGANCATGSTCNSPPNGTPTCTLLPTKGEKCTFQCATGLVCAAGTCAERVAVGGACPTGLECQSTLYCDGPTKLCTAYKIAKAGEACGNGTTGTRCDAGLACKTQGQPPVGTCVALKARGEACISNDGECASYLTCISGTCQIPDPSQCK